VWRWGEFAITIYEDEKEEIENMNPLIINDHGGEFISTENGWQDDIEIKNFESYSDEEKLAIYESVFEDIENKVLHDSSVLEDENGWELDDTIYEIYCGIELEEE
jgi:predicted SpoU family rRNA methylase